MTIEKIEIRVLEASEGMTLTNGEIYAKKVYLGKHDSPDNWWEIPDEDVPPEKEEE